MNIFVAKLNYRTTSDTLRTLFETYGTVDYAKVIIDRETGRSKGFAFVEMPNADEANRAISTLNETEFDGSTIVVKEAQPREERGGGGDRGGYSGGGGGGGFKKPYKTYSGGGNNNGGGGGGFRKDRNRYDD
jgi:RNA recognition motif-containing protein